MPATGVLLSSERKSKKKERIRLLVKNKNKTKTVIYVSRNGPKSPIEQRVPVSSLVQKHKLVS